MDAELQRLTNEGRRSLRRAADKLTPEEQVEDAHGKEVRNLESFMLRKLGVTLPLNLHAKVAWTANGPAITLEAEGRAFIMRKDGKRCSLLLKDGDGGEREVAGIEADDPEFSSRFLVALGDDWRISRARPVIGATWGGLLIWSVWRRWSAGSVQRGWIE